MTRRLVHTAHDRPRFTPERIVGAVLVLVNGGGLLYYFSLRRQRQQRVDDYARLTAQNNADANEAGDTTLDVATARELARTLYGQWPEGGVTHHDVEVALAELRAEPGPRESALEIFRQFDRNGEGITSSEELLLVSALFANGSVDERARLVYDVFDGNQDGRITRHELESMLDRLPIAVMYSLAVRAGMSWMVEYQSRRLRNDSLLRERDPVQVVATLFGDKSYTTPVSRSEFMQHPVVVGLLADGLADGELRFFFQRHREVVDLFLRAVVRAAVKKQRTKT